MNIVIKFSIGNILWYMRQNRPVQGKVEKIKITIDEIEGKTRMHVVYIGKWYGTQWEFEENQYHVFATKEELLKSL